MVSAYERAIKKIKTGQFGDIGMNLLKLCPPNIEIRQKVEQARNAYRAGLQRSRTIPAPIGGHVRPAFFWDKAKPRDNRRVMIRNQPARTLRIQQRLSLDPALHKTRKLTVTAKPVKGTRSVAQDPERFDCSLLPHKLRAAAASKCFTH